LYAVLSVILDITEHLALAPAVEDPDAKWTAIAAAVGSIIGGLVTVGKIIAWVREHARQKGYDKIWADKSTATPKPLPVPDPDRASMLMRITAAEQRTAELSAMWKQHDAEAKLAEAVVEMTRLRKEVVHERTVNAELLRANESLRRDNAAMQLALDRSEDVVDVVPVDDDWAEETLPPLARNPLRPR
jgi:hypothetical protein